MTDTSRFPSPPPAPEGEETVRPFGPRLDDKPSLVRGVVYVVAFAWAILSGNIGALGVIVAIFVMIMLHELGHYVMARRAGMKVTEFYLGFGPKVWTTQRGETEYGVKAFPLGGYVKIIGMNNLDEVAPEDEPRAYRQKSYAQRMGVAVAGSTMHAIIAFVLLMVLHGFFTVVDYSKDPTTTIGALSKLETGEAPAAAAGLRAGDKLIAINGVPIANWEDIRPQIEPNVGKDIVFDIERKGVRQSVHVTPVDRRAVRFQGEGQEAIDKATGFVGIAPAYPETKPSLVSAPVDAAKDFGHWTKLSVVSLSKLADPHGLSNYARQVAGEAPTPAPGSKDAQDTPRFVSPIGLGNLASQASNAGIVAVLLLLVNINIFVGIFNMIPLPPFDGGHVAVATYERIRSRKGRRYMADAAKLIPVAVGVIGFLMLLFVTSLVMDIRHPL